MSKFFVQRSQILENTIILEGGDVNHIRNVLRMRVGESIEICDGQGMDYDCIVSEYRDQEAILDIVNRYPTDVELSIRLVLYQGLPKKDKMELIIQKAVELGAAEIVPVACSRSIVKLEDGKKEEKKRERWQMIAEGAAKQSGRGFVPVVAPAMGYKEAMKRASSEGRILFPYENANGMIATKKALIEAAKEGTTSIFIGPEGGFAPEEVELAKNSGGQVISLGRRILRTETAGLTILSALMLLSECNAETENPSDNK